MVVYVTSVSAHSSHPAQPTPISSFSSFSSTIQVDPASAADDFGTTTLFSLATDGNAANPTDSSSPEPDAVSQHHSSSMGAIIGGVVGGVAAVCAVIAAAYIWYRRRRPGGSMEISSKENLPAMTDVAPASSEPSSYTASSTLIQAVRPLRLYVRRVSSVLDCSGLLNSGSCAL